jgi:restriction system protein
MTLTVLAIWVVSLAQKVKRGTLLKQAGDINRLKEISWHDFELLVGEYYRRRGFRVEERGGSSADGGVDLVLRKDGQTILVQCKHWKAFKVGVKPVRELGGVMGHERANGGILVTSGRFTAEAETFARQNRIELVSGGQLVEMVRSVQGIGQAAAIVPPSVSPQRPAVEAESGPACPKCGGPMKLKTAQRGAYAGSQFWGCARYPNCSGIINVKSR